METKLSASSGSHDHSWKMQTSLSELNGNFDERRVGVVYSSGYGTAVPSIKNIIIFTDTII